MSASDSHITICLASTHRKTPLSGALSEFKPLESPVQLCHLAKPPPPFVKPSRCCTDMHVELNKVKIMNKYMQLHGLPMMYMVSCSAHIYTTHLAHPPACAVCTDHSKWLPYQSPQGLHRCQQCYRKHRHLLCTHPSAWTDPALASDT
jgi:hypothetical protein